jgi:sterol desaturase/sphingolipid hydroxylase (fatty acid hydroxylase superfamily)
MIRAKLAYYGDFVTVPIAIIVLTIFAARAGVGLALSLIAAGFAVWTLLEYLLHRFAMHMFQPGYRLHQPHHDHPVNMKAERSSLSTLFIAAAVGFLLMASFGLNAGMATLAGLLLGYYGFIVVHHAVHRWTIRPNSWLYREKLRHAAHHHSDDCEFGVITPFWDIVFRTTH